MANSMEKLRAKVSEEDLKVRLERATGMIGKMCSEKRPPKMSIPVQHYDEDIFIIQTLKDAIEAIEELEKEVEYLIWRDGGPA